MFNIPMLCGELPLDGLVDTGVFTTSISETELNKMKFLFNKKNEYTSEAQLPIICIQRTTPLSPSSDELKVRDKEL